MIRFDQKYSTFYILLLLIVGLFLFGCTDDAPKSDRFNSEKQLVDSLLVQSENIRNADPLAILPLADSARTLARQINYPKGELSGMYNIAIGHFFLNEFDEAEEWCQAIFDNGKTMEIDSLTLFKYMGSAHNLSGIIWQRKGEYESAIQDFLKALNYFESTQDLKNAASVYTNMSECFRFMKNFDKALDYNFKAEQIYREKKLFDRLTTVFQNRGNIFNNEGKYEEALTLFKQTLDSSKLYNDVENMVHALNNIGVSYEEMGRSDQAIEYYFRALDIYKSRKNYWGEANTLGNISVIYLQRNDYEKAITFSQNAVAISRKNDFRELILYNYENLARIYERMGRGEESLQIYKNISEIKDSLYNEEKFRTISSLEQRYKEVRAENLIAQKDKELIQAQLNSKTLLIFVIVLGVIIFLSLIIAYFLYKQVQLRKQKNFELRQKNSIIKHKNLEITHQRDEIKNQKEDLELVVNAYETHREKEILIGKRSIPINDIVYIKYHNRISHVFLKNGNIIEHRVQLSQLASELKYKSNFLFAQINQNYVVNFNNVDIRFFDQEEEKFYYTPFLKTDHEDGRTEDYVKTRKRSGLNKNFEREYNRYLRLKNFIGSN
jgi:tetratricopeptide (TPR) repeat protein